MLSYEGQIEGRGEGGRGVANTIDAFTFLASGSFTKFTKGRGWDGTGAPPPPPPGLPMSATKSVINHDRFSSDDSVHYVAQGFYQWC